MGEVDAVEREKRVVGVGMGGGWGGQGLWEGGGGDAEQNAPHSFERMVKHGRVEVL